MAGPGCAGAPRPQRLGPGACKQAGAACAGAALPVGSAGGWRGGRSSLPAEERGAIPSGSSWCRGGGREGNGKGGAISPGMLLLGAPSPPRGWGWPRCAAPALRGGGGMAAPGLGMGGEGEEEEGELRVWGLVQVTAALPFPLRPHPPFLGLFRVHLIMAINSLLSHRHPNAWGTALRKKKNLFISIYKAPHPGEGRSIKHSPHGDIIMQRVVFPCQRLSGV